MNTTDLSHSKTIRYINAGIALHNSDFSAQKIPYNAEDYLAAGYIHEKYVEGVEVARTVINMVKRFVQSAFERENVGSSMFVNSVEFVTKLQGSTLCIYAGPNGNLIACIEGTGIESAIKVNFGEGFSAQGEVMIRHGEVDKDRKHAFLIARYYPVGLVTAAIGFAARKSTEN